MLGIKYRYHVNHFLLYFHTVRHLKLRQVFFRVYYFARKRFAAVSLPRAPKIPVSRHLIFTQGIPRSCSFEGTTFTFLNLTNEFSKSIDWNYAGYGKLWCYNLNYFDFLNQESVARQDGLNLIYDFINSTDTRSVGFEPYPTSLRIINWIKFISRHDIHDDVVDRSLYQQALLISKNIEYHLLGNHVLENAFSLLFAGRYFADISLQTTARSILREELKEQILPDGAHFELSPMYHQIILDRLLDCVNLLKKNGGDPLLPLLIDKGSEMLGWLRQITFRDGSIPLLNDAAEGIAPASAELFEYARRIDLAERIVPLKESGYRKITGNSYEMVMDVGNIGPDYIPGHAHSDTLSFVLHLDGRPLIVDTGTSTYEINDQRLLERQTTAHNTVEIDGLQQSEVWGSFRVAQRAYICDLAEFEDHIVATHTGYDRIGARHRREFAWDERAITITDTVESDKFHDSRAYLHFYPDVRVSFEDGVISAGKVLISFEGASEVKVEDYLSAPKFNMHISAKKVTIFFSDKLTTSILLNSNALAQG